MQNDIVFAGSIPELYDRYLGPLIFASYAADLAARLSDLKGGAHVLETAAGTGIVTRALDKAMPGSVSIMATDLNQAMLDYGAKQLASTRVAWRQADATALPFPDAHFDAVVCQFGAMFFPDKVKAFAEARRVLKEGGRFVFNVWARIEENEFPHSVMGALARVFPDDPPKFMERTPHGYHDTKHIVDDLRRAGFARLDIETVAKTSDAPSAREPAIGFCQGTPMRGEIEARDKTRLGEATDAAEQALVARFGKGRISGRISAHVITAWR
jgi:ubiquinone/menaquinone biosynthesis C-methylase UbiE